MDNFYVYTLSYPDGRVFYVGKGTGDRINEHERLARHGDDSDKSKTIRQIWRDNEEVKKDIIFTTNNAADALAQEKIAIAKFGLDHLTNCLSGGGRITNRTIHAEQKEIDFKLDLIFFIYQICDTGNWSQLSWRGKLLRSGIRCSNQRHKKLCDALENSLILIERGPCRKGQLISRDPEYILDVLGLDEAKLITDRQCLLDRILSESEPIDVDAGSIPDEVPHVTKSLIKVWTTDDITRITRQSQVSIINTAKMLLGDKYTDDFEQGCLCAMTAIRQICNPDNDKLDVELELHELTDTGQRYSARHGQRGK